MRRVDPWPDDGGSAERGLRTGSAIAAEVATSVDPGDLAGRALAHAQAMVTAADATLDRLAERGWRTVAGEVPGAGRVASGREAVSERTEMFDAFEPLLGRR
jgi:hypothetical protein